MPSSGESIYIYSKERSVPAFALLSRLKVAVVRLLSSLQDSRVSIATRWLFK